MIEDLWYKNTVIYSLDLETFMDANGDGVGDFEGLTRRLEYLQALGISTIWLSPFQPTPNRDNGYDISDFYGVDPRHGSSGDFVEFMQHAKKRGMKSSWISSSTTPPISIDGSRNRAQTSILNIAIGTFGRRNVLRIGKTGMVFPGVRSQLGHTTKKHGSITFTAFTISTRISTRTIRPCGLRFVASWATGLNWA